ncbi:hypothetical protein EHS25_005408 [Saitozyma podzolica]|uniref:Uncharacterized protein n=1 Tax=Saitozyma podzolica TaxID=1890683 RepID=A0A427XY95_9TREE|nr:hypothetical protein EHS25_005408 [Saitozyma podzolica]
MPQFSQLSQSSQVRALIMRDGDTGTFKSSLCKALGGDAQVQRSVGESITGPSDVRVVDTPGLPMLDPMGHNDTRGDGGSYGRFSDLEVKKLIIGTWAEAGYDHIASFHLHLPASCRTLRIYHDTLAFAYDILDGHLGHLVIFMVNCLDPDGFIGIDVLVKKYQSKNGPPKIVALYHPQQTPSPSVVATNRYLHFLEGQVARNWEAIDAISPKVPPLKDEQRALPEMWTEG